MTKDDIDQMWNQAMNEAVKNGENFTRYRFAALVAKHEREACAKVCDKYAEGPERNYSENIADDIRARSQP